jgi:anaerobic magnesium-protoporphyrin IX monomethyl ester cyclase
MKVMFLQPPDPPEGRILRDMAGRFGIRVSKDAQTLLPPLEFAYAASVLEKRGHAAKIVDAPALEFDAQRVLEVASKEKPELIVANTTPVSLNNDLNICNDLKERLPDTLVCLTGAFVSVMPETAFESQVNVVVRNEIEFTILDLLEAYKEQHFEEVKGIAFKEKGKIIKTPDRALIKDLDALPFPAFHLLPVDQYYHNWFSEKDKPFMTVLASRGCSYGCVYCPYPVGYGNCWRSRSPQNVLDEITLLVEKYHVRSILFRDQVFTFDMKRTKELCLGIVERKLDFKWRCETRADRLSKSIMQIMKDAGCEGIHMGVESGDPQVLSRIGKPGADIAKTKQTFVDANILGIKTGAFFIIGLPGETKRSVWESFELALEINPDVVSVAAITPYPGTELFNMAEKKGWILTKDWSKYTGFNVVMRTDDLSAEDIHKAIEFFNKCVGYRNKKTENDKISRRNIQEALRRPSSAAKWVLKRVKNKISDPREEFKNWALERY